MGDVSRSGQSSAKKFKSSPRNVKKFKTVCKYWLEGICGKGDECQFMHEGEPKTLTTRVCNYFLIGTCLKGKKCPYSHDTRLVPCKFHHVKGFCNQGKLCKYSHKPISKDLQEKLKKDYDTYQKYEKKAGQRSFLFDTSATSSEEVQLENWDLPKSTEKAQLALKIYQLPQILEGVDEEEKGWIEEAIRKYKPYSSPF